MPAADSARSALNTNDLRGKINRIKVKDGDITPADANKATYTGAGAARTRSRPATCSRSSAGAPQAKTRPEVYAMGFRNPFRHPGRRERRRVRQRLLARLADAAAVPRRRRASGRFEIVRHPANYGWPYCFKPDLPEYPWNVNLQVPMDALTHQPVPAGQTPQPYSCAGATVPNNDCWNVNGGPSVEPGLTTIAGPDRRRTSGTRTATTTRRRRWARRASPPTARTR